MKAVSRPPIGHGDLDARAANRDLDCFAIAISSKNQAQIQIADPPGHFNSTAHSLIRLNSRRMIMEEFADGFDVRLITILYPGQLVIKEQTCFTEKDLQW
jgi:hypothetical protein